MSTEPQTPETTSDEAMPEDAVGKSAYLVRELEACIKAFDRESTRHKQLFRRLRYIVFGLTACSSALAGLALAFPKIQTGTTVGIILTTAAIGIVTSVEGLRKPSELWIHERTIHYSLLDLQRALGYYLAADSTNPEESEPTSPMDTNAYFERLQSILGSSQDKWSRDIAARTPPVERSDSTPPAGAAATPGTDSE